MPPGQNPFDVGSLPLAKPPRPTTPFMPDLPLKNPFEVAPLPATSGPTMASTLTSLPPLPPVPGYDAGKAKSTPNPFDVVPLPQREGSFPIGNVQKRKQIAVMTAGSHKKRPKLLPAVPDDRHVHWTPTRSELSSSPLRSVAGTSPLVFPNTPTSSVVEDLHCSARESDSAYNEDAVMSDVEKEVEVEVNPLQVRSKPANKDGKVKKRTVTGEREEGLDMKTEGKNNPSTTEAQVKGEDKVEGTDGTGEPVGTVGNPLELSSDEEMDVDPVVRSTGWPQVDLQREPAEVVQDTQPAGVTRHQGLVEAIRGIAADFEASGMDGRPVSTRTHSLNFSS